jgi:DNA repair protein RadD
MIDARPYQLDAVASVWRFMERGYGNPVVVAPTGAGKSIIIGLIVADAIRMWAPTRCLVMADAKELIEQNAEAYASVSPMAPYGIYSASVGPREFVHAVTFAQIQSCYDKAGLFGYQDFIIVDECHMINPKQMGMYRTFIEGLKEVNPDLKIVGLTATPYRLGHGYVFKGDESLFTGVAYDIGIETLIAEGFLVMPIARAGTVHADTDKIEHGSNGEFKEASAQAEFSRITDAAVSDMIARLPDRKSVLIFACSLDHAAEIAECLYSHEETAIDVVTGTTSKGEREAIVERVRSGVTRWLVNCAVFTKGFNAKNIDAVVLLRATESAALFVQMVGRGLRPFPGKKDCIVLDYGENVTRHGPINAIKPRPKREGGSNAPREVMAKECVNCQAMIAVGCKTCPHCDAAQPVSEAIPNHSDRPSDAPLIGNAEQCIWKDVIDVRYDPHGMHTVASKRSMKVSYRVGTAEWVSEWICPEHNGYAREKAAKWMEKRGYNLMEVDAALLVEWPKPTRIKIKYGGKWPEIIDHEVSIF